MIRKTLVAVLAHAYWFAGVIGALLLALYTSIESNPIVGVVVAVIVYVILLLGDGALRSCVDEWPSEIGVRLFDLFPPW